MTPLKITHLAGNTYYIPCPTNIGLYVKNDEATIVDTGIDKDVAKQILKLLSEKEWTLKTIINTHSHADHIGGNAFLAEKTGSMIAAPRGEVAYIENTQLEPAFLYGGYPYKALRNKFLMAKSSCVQLPIESEGLISGSDLMAISLRGHSVDMMGIRTPDGSVFIADSLLPENIVKKYHLFYLWDIEAHLNTLESLGNLKATLWIPSHGEVISDITQLIAINVSKIQEIIEKILTCCETKNTTEQILEYLCREYVINLNATQYALVSNTVKSYLSYLLNKGQLDVAYDDYKMTWRCK